MKDIPSPLSLVCIYVYLIEMLNLRSPFSNLTMTFFSRIDIPRRIDNWAGILTQIYLLDSEEVAVIEAPTDVVSGNFSPHDIHV